MKTTLLLIHILTVFYCFSQDTIKVEPSIYYSTEEEKKLTRKGFYGDYGKELIAYSKEVKRVEYCYYVDSIERKCIGTDYKIIEDSILLIEEIDKRNDLESWNFKKLENGNYFLDRVNNGVYDFGEFKELIPLEPIKPIFTTTLDKLDTLWNTSYGSNCNQYLDYRTTKFHENEIMGKIYEYDKVNIPPTQINGKPLKKLSIKRIVSCPSEPAFMDVLLVAIIVTKEGEIKNIEQAIGTLYEGCPFTMQEIIKEIKSWGKLSPAIRKGKKVNVRWFVEINNIARNYIHPAIEDSKKNRKSYIRKKKTVDKNGLLPVQHNFIRDEKSR